MTDIRGRIFPRNVTPREFREFIYLFIFFTEYGTILSIFRILIAITVAKLWTYLILNDINFIHRRITNVGEFPVKDFPLRSW